GIGPHLNDVVGRRAASVTGFDYSKDMSRAGEEGLVWTPEFLSDYLRRPETFLPETKMAFSGISDAAEREALIAYLETLNQRAERLIEAANETESGPPVVDYGDTE
ncbi:MAG: cytochrome C, partial [Pseudomonadota bacterium]